MTVDERLDRLERQYRWLKGGLASLVVAAVATGLLFFAPQYTIPDLVEARAFHVVGEDGTTLVKQEGSPGGGMVSTMHGEGHVLVSLSALGGMGTVTTMNGEGQDLVSLWVTEGGNGMVKTMNGEGKEIVTLTATGDGEGVVTT